MMLKTLKRWWWLVLALALVTAFAAVYGAWQLSRARDFQLFGKLVSHVDTSEKVIALTFDDGPTQEYTAGVLALLREKGVKATFFIIGADAEKNPDDLKAIVADGHEVGNHTFVHDDMTLASSEKAASEIERTDAVIRKAGYSGEILFRPPFGKKLIGLPLYLANHNRMSVTWDVEPESFRQIAADPDLIAAHVIERTKPGSIIIMHVMYKARETSREALPQVIDGLREKGFRFVTVSELIALESK
jgi:peptidoglycan-N-acetylglucosamine deacetylase